MVKKESGTFVKIMHVYEITMSLIVPHPFDGQSDLCEQSTNSAP